MFLYDFRMKFFKIRIIDKMDLNQIIFDAYNIAKMKGEGKYGLRNYDERTYENWNESS